MNFTKEDSLYGSGMRVVVSKQSEGFILKRGCENIEYQPSVHVRKRNKNP